MQKTKYAVIGSDVSKSLSPRMQMAAFKHHKLPNTYEALSIPPNEFNERMSSLIKEYAGLNVTIPYKEKALDFVGAPSPLVTKLHALNTLKFDWNAIYGENTDVDGLMTAISAAGYGVSPDASAFMIGAGGAARATIEALTSFGVKGFTVAGRSSQRVSEFESWFKHYYPDFSLKMVPFDSKEAWITGIRDAQLFVNSVPNDVYHEILFSSEIQFSHNVLVIDWNYLPKMTHWIKKALAVKGTPVYGYEILLYQGAKSFTFWTKLEAPVSIMKNALLEELI